MRKFDFLFVHLDSHKNGVKVKRRCQVLSRIVSKNLFVKNWIPTDHFVAKHQEINLKIQEPPKM